jgi:hypothetical protein
MVSDDDAKHCRDFILEHMPQHLVLQRALEDIGIETGPIEVLDEHGGLLPAAQDVLTVIKEYDLTVCTGHISPTEGMALIRNAKERGIRKMMITHVNWGATRYDITSQKELAAQGAFVEYCYSALPDSYKEKMRCFANIREVGPAHCVVSTDLGQAQNLAPVEGFAKFLSELREFGFSRPEIERMAVHNPRLLVE